MTGPTLTGTGIAWPFLPMVMTALPAWSVMTALSGTSRTLTGRRLASRMLPKMPGNEETVGVGDDGAGANRAGIALDAIVGEVDRAVPAIVRLILESDFDGLRGGARRRRARAAP